MLVVDPGSSCVKAGWSGEDLPSSIFPSSLTKWLPNTDAIEPYVGGGGGGGAGGGVESTGTGAGASADFTLSASPHPIHRGQVKDWDQMEKLWQVILDEVGVTSPETTSVLLAESPRATPSDRAKWAEILFEAYRAPSMCIGNSSALCVFSAGRTSGVVVECGAGLTSSVPVFEGLALAHAAITMEFGGQDISQTLRKLLADHAGTQIEMADVRLVKERLAYVSTGVAGKGRSGEGETSVNLPDGTEVRVRVRVRYVPHSARL